MSVNLKKIIKLLDDFTKKEKKPLEVIILGGQAMEYYGMKGRKTRDLDAEVNGNVDKLLAYLRKNKIPADIGEDISAWGIVSMPPDYRKNTIVIYENQYLKIKVLDPLYFVIAKLRRGTESDWKDIVFIIKKYKLSKKKIQKLAEDAIKNSPKDTALFIFKKSVEHLLKKL